MVMPQDSLEFPVIEGVEGGISDDGQAVLLKLSTVEDAAIHFCLRHCDLEALLRICSAWLRTAKMRHRERTVSGISPYRHRGYVPGSSRMAWGVSA
jgi:hypothetical protein